MTDPLVTSAWLAENRSNVVVLDATYFLPPDPARSLAEFEAARIPGARLFPIDDVSDHSADLPHMLPDADQLASALAGLGIDGSKPVVVYDRSANHFSAPRVWYTLRLFGLRDTYVLDGGLAHWQSGGHPIASGPSEAIDVTAQPAVTFDRARVVDSQQMAALVAGGERPILDARSPDRFAGRAPEPRAGLSSGHMPGATCVPFTELTGPDGRFLSADALKALFPADSGVAPVVSCGSGMTACVLALGLDRIGRDVFLYDGSWAEWGQGTLGPILTE